MRHRLFSSSTAPQQITLPLGGVVQVIIDWGDGTQDSSLTHTYASTGTFQLSINKNANPTGPWLTFFGSQQCDLTAPLLPYANVLSFGDLGIQSLRAAFGATRTNFGVPATLPTTVTDLSCLFENSTRFNQSNIVSWDVSRVTNMTGMFKNAYRFAQLIGSWDVSNVRSMASMFAMTYDFNQTIDTWDVSRVTDMSSMFYLSRFNRELNAWDVSSVQNMDSMFHTSQFNRDLNDWNVGQVTWMETMFQLAGIFNRPLGSLWMEYAQRDRHVLPFNANRFNGSIGTWDVSQVTNMASMFFNNYAFNKPLRQWNVAQVRNMNQLFWGTSSFNQPLDGWTVYRVTDMNFMFYSSVFNQSLTSWCVPISMPASFASALPVSQWPRWGTCPEYVPVTQSPPFQAAPIGSGSAPSAVTQIAPSSNNRSSGNTIVPYWAQIVAATCWTLLIASRR